MHEHLEAIAFYRTIRELLNLKPKDGMRVQLIGDEVVIRKTEESEK